MSEARKCDRCSSYFEYDENMNNYIVFGNRHIFVDLKRGKDFDICPKCMMEFEDWFFPSEEEETESDSETTKNLCYFERCKECLSLFRRPPLPGETGYSEVRCGRWHTSIPLRGADPKLIDSITPDMFIKDDDERVNNLYKEAEEISNNAGDIKEPKLSDPYEEGGL